MWYTKLIGKNRLVDCVFRYAVSESIMKKLHKWGGKRKVLCDL